MLKRKHSKWTKAFAETHEEADRLIKELHSKGLTWAEIANNLNKKGFVTPTGKNWDRATTPAYALRAGLVPRRLNTSAGAAGSTGVPNYSRLNGLSLVKKERSPRGITDQELEDVWTSNLSPAIKRKITRLLALGGGL